MNVVNHALYRTGQLGDKLFEFPQIRSFDLPLLLLESTYVNGFINWVVVQDLAMDLGMVNMAKRIVGEIMENVGPYPDILYRRALIQIAKGNNDAASVYLHKLEVMLFYRTEAKRLLGKLNSNSDFLSEPTIAAMHANMDTTDYILFTISYKSVFRNLLLSNPGNKAAYDYLMTWYLISGQSDEIADLAHQASRFGYTDLPRCWEEALCVYLASNSQQPAFKPSFDSLKTETVMRFNEFTRDKMQLAYDPAAASKLATTFGDSYYYFYIFGYTRGKRLE